MAECKQADTEISEDEINGLAFNIPPNNMHRIAVEFLYIPEPKVAHATSAAKNGVEFAAHCLNMFVNDFDGNNLRESLYFRLSKASDSRLVSRKVYQFLVDLQHDDGESNKCSPNRDDLLLNQEETDSSVQDRNGLVPGQNQRDVVLFPLFSRLAALFTSIDGIQLVALNVFNFPKTDFEVQKWLLSQRIMLQVLTRWFRLTEESATDTRSRLIEKLKMCRQKGLVIKQQMDKTLEQLNWKEAGSEDSLARKSNRATAFEMRPIDTDVLNDIAKLFFLESMDKAAVDIFGIPQKEIQNELELGFNQLMLNVLCTWWRLQEGSLYNKKEGFRTKLLQVKSCNLVSDDKLSEIVHDLSPETTHSKPNLPQLETDQPHNNVDDSTPEVIYSQTDSIQASNAQPMPNNQQHDHGHVQDSEVIDCLNESSAEGLEDRSTVTDSESDCEDRESPRYEFDLYCSYAEEDFELIRDRLLPHLENHHDVRIVIPHRDFKIGLLVMRNIVDFMDRSRKVLCVISNDWNKDQWRQEELQIAEHMNITERGGDPSGVIHLILPGTNLDHIDKELKRSLERHPPIHLQSYNDQKTLNQLVKIIKDEPLTVRGKIVSTIGKLLKKIKS